MSSRTKLSRAIARYLALIKAHNAWFTLIVALLIIAAANIVIAGVLHADLGLGAELSLEAVIVVVGVAVPVGLTLVMLWPELKEISNIISSAPPKATPILLRFVGEELKLLGDRISDTRSRGIELEKNVVGSWIRDRCFTVATGSYRATDVLVPSKFLSLYPAYLQAHADYVKRISCNSSVRINVSPLDELTADSAAHPEALEAYKQWHRDHGVELFYLDSELASDISRQAGLGNTLDLAIWEGELALLVEYLANGATNLRLALVGETSYRRSEAFFQAVLEASVPLDDIQLGTPREAIVTARR